MCLFLYRATRFLCFQGYPLPSTKAMQRHIKNVTVKLEEQHQLEDAKQILPRMCPIPIGEHVVPVVHQVTQQMSEIPIRKMYVRISA